MGANLKIASEQGFQRKQNHPLTTILKKLNKEAEGAVEMLVTLMTAKESDDKTKLAAASKLLEFQRQAAQDINQDELQRMIANIKFGGPKQLTYEDDATPDVDFTQVLPAN